MASIDLFSDPEEMREYAEKTVTKLEETWNLDYIDGRGCQNQHNALLFLIGKHLDRIANELELINRRAEAKEQSPLEVE